MGTGGSAGLASGGSAGASSGGSAGAASGGAPPSNDIEISKGRFTRNSKPFFLTGNFLSSKGSPGPFTHTYLSDQVSQAKRTDMLNIAKQNGYNIFSIYTYNEGDYNKEKITPFANNGFGGAFNAARIKTWQSRVQAIVKAGLHPVIWLVPDDSPVIHKASNAALKTYITKMVQSFDSYPVIWILALEADEYWNATKVADLGKHLASKTKRPVGIHQLNGQSSYMKQSWVEFGAYQYGFGKKWQQIFDATVSLKKSLGKPLIGMEYDLLGGSNDERLGLAAAFGGAVGVGNGAPKGLAPFMSSLPGGMVSSRSGNKATLKGGGVTATANLDTLKFSK